MFHNRGSPEYFIGSADLMTRNLDHRIEALVPIYDGDAQITIQNILDQQWFDNTKARRLDAAQLNHPSDIARGGVSVRSQESIHRYLAYGTLPRIPKSVMRRVSRRRKKHSKID